jgi:uncharacterized protein
MIRAADLPDTISVFPLSGALLLPRSRLPLNIFEPRYLQMLEDALKTPQRLIGMIQPNPMPGTQNALHAIGCAGRVTQFTEADDGRNMITLSGVSRFRILREVEGFTPYRRCDVSWDGFDADLNKTEGDKSFDRPAFLILLKRYFSARKMSTDWEALTESGDEVLINSLSMLLEFAPEDRQALLEAPSLTTRRETLATLLEYSLRGGANEEILQ